METFELSEVYIHLNQLLKAMGWCGGGGEANTLIDEGQVKVNGVKELRRRNKITAGMVVELGTKKVKVARIEE